MKKKFESYNGWTGKDIPIAKLADKFQKVQERKDENKIHSWKYFWGYMAGYKMALRKRKKK